MGKLGEIESTVIAGYFNSHVDSNVEDYENKHGIYVMKLEIRKRKAFWSFLHP